MEGQEGHTHILFSFWDHLSYDCGAGAVCQGQRKAIPQ